MTISLLHACVSFVPRVVVFMSNEPPETVSRRFWEALNDFLEHPHGGGTRRLVRGSALPCTPTRVVDRQTQMEYTQGHAERCYRWRWAYDILLEVVQQQRIHSIEYVPRHGGFRLLLRQQGHEEEEDSSTATKTTMVDVGLIISPHEASLCIGACLSVVEHSHDIVYLEHGCGRRASSPVTWKEVSTATSLEQQQQGAAPLDDPWTSASRHALITTWLPLIALPTRMCLSPTQEEDGIFLLHTGSFLCHPSAPHLQRRHHTQRATCWQCFRKCLFLVDHPRRGSRRCTLHTSDESYVTPKGCTLQGFLKEYLGGSVGTLRDVVEPTPGLFAVAHEQDKTWEFLAVVADTKGRLHIASPAVRRGAMRSWDGDTWCVRALCTCASVPLDLMPWLQWLHVCPSLEGEWGSVVYHVW